MLVKNYRPISLLPIFGKTFEKAIYYQTFHTFPICFFLGDSCIAQLLSLIYEIQTAFDENPTVDVRGVFLDVSKAFDKVCCDGIIFKLKAYGAEGELLSLLQILTIENKEQP